MNIVKNLLKYKKTFMGTFSLTFIVMMVSQFTFIKPQFGVTSLMFCGRVISFETKGNNFVDVSVNHLENPANIAEYIRVHFKSIDGFGGLRANVLKKSPFYLSVTSYADSIDQAKDNMTKLEKRLTSMFERKLKINRELVSLEKENYLEQYKNLVDVGAKAQKSFNMNLMELTALNKVISNKLERASRPGFLSNVGFGEMTPLSDEPVSPNRKVLTCFIFLLSSIFGLIVVLFLAESES